MVSAKTFTIRFYFMCLLCRHSFSWCIFILPVVGAEESAPGSPERSREPAGSPQSPGWKPPLPAGRAPDTHRQPQGHSVWRLHTEGQQRKSDPRLTHCTSFRLKRPPCRQPKDSVPPGVPLATAGTAGARTQSSWGRVVCSEEAAGRHAAGRRTGRRAAASSSRERGPVGTWGGGETSGGHPEDTRRSNQDKHLV